MLAIEMQVVKCLFTGKLSLTDHLDSRVVFLLEMVTPFYKLHHPQGVYTVKYGNYELYIIPK